MPKFAANLSMLFTEHPFLERFAHAKAAGFQAVEFLFPYEHDTSAIAARAAAQRAGAGAVQSSRGQFRGRRSRHGERSEPGRRVPRRRPSRIEDRGRARLRTTELPGGAATGRRARGDADGDADREPALCRRRRRQRRVSSKSSSRSTRSTLLVTFCPHRNRGLPSLSELRIPISCCNTTSITPSA